MYSIDEYKKLTSKYSRYSSWAIWDYESENDSSIINRNFNQLHSKFVFLGLNIACPLTTEPWSNFHGGKHDRKIKYACNDNKLRGSYITDIFKGIDESKSTKFKRLLTDGIINENVALFIQEMADIKINTETQFVIFGVPGSLIAKNFNKNFKQEFKNRVIHYYHYSHYKLTDKEWVTGLWRKLDIKQNFDSTIKKYK